ncbi:MAG: hypothetical protein V3V08_06220 [Nannocystaceae bacterium]
MAPGHDSRSAAVGGDAATEWIDLHVLSAAADGVRVNIWVPALCPDHHLQAREDLGRIFEAWPAMESWRVELLGEFAASSAIDAGMFGYLRDVVCCGVRVHVAGLPSATLSSLRETFSGIEMIERGGLIEGAEERLAIEPAGERAWVPVLWTAA